MKVLAYTENYAHETATFITNELKCVQDAHQLLLAYSIRINPDRYNLNLMVQIPYSFNKFINKLRWWLEQYEIYYSLNNYIFKIKLNNVIKEFNPDIIHCHFGTDFLKVISNIDNQNKSIPILVSFYGFDVTEKVKNKAILKKYKHFFAFKNIYSIAVSDSLVNNINQLINPYNKANAVHSGIDTNFFTRLRYELNPQEFIFLQVSSFLEKKGHHHMLIAFKKFIESNTRYTYKFIIAGFGPLQNQVLNHIKELKLENYIIFKDSITPSEMVELSSRANCFVQMSITADNGDQEGLPNVLLEAMSLELPILSTIHAGIPEIVENGVNGILCEEKNIDQYVKAFNSIVDWKTCPHNREKIINKFSLQAHMTSLNSIYDKITSNVFK